MAMGYVSGTGMMSPPTANMSLPLSNSTPIVVDENTPNLEEVQGFPVVGRAAGFHFHQDPVSGQMYRMTDDFHAQIPKIIQERIMSSDTNYSMESLNGYINESRPDTPRRIINTPTEIDLSSNSDTFNTLFSSAFNNSKMGSFNISSNDLNAKTSDQYNIINTYGDTSSNRMNDSFTYTTTNNIRYDALTGKNIITESIPLNKFSNTTNSGYKEVIKNTQVKNIPVNKFGSGVSNNYVPQIDSGKNGVSLNRFADILSLSKSLYGNFNRVYNISLTHFY